MSLHDDFPATTQLFTGEFRSHYGKWGPECQRWVREFVRPLQVLGAALAGCAPASTLAAAADSRCPHGPFAGTDRADDALAAQHLHPGPSCMLVIDIAAPLAFWQASSVPCRGRAGCSGAAAIGAGLVDMANPTDRRTAPEEGYGIFVICRQTPARWMDGNAPSAGTGRNPCAAHH
jgi:hypothetical protein